MRLFKIFGLVLGVVIVQIAGLWWACAPHQPSNAKLQHQFDKHRTDLDRLVQMMEEDSQMSRIAPEFLWRQDSVAWPRPEAEWGISKSRWDEYRALFDKAGAQNGTTRREGSSDIIIDTWSWGIVPSGISVGYLHCGEPRAGYVHKEEPCIEGRESGRGTHGHSESYGYRYHRIAKDWYLYEESN